MSDSNNCAVGFKPDCMIGTGGYSSDIRPFLRIALPVSIDSGCDNRTVFL
jgi:hypothetical protein